MTAEEIVKAARDAGFSSSEIHKKLPEFKRLIEFAAAAEREACAQRFATITQAQTTRTTQISAPKRYAQWGIMPGVKFILIVLGAFHLTMCTVGNADLVDYHVCIKEAGACGDHQ